MLQTENRQENSLCQCSTPSGCPAAHLDHELFVNTDNQWAKDCIDHMTRINTGSTCQLFTAECIKACRFLLNPSSPPAMILLTTHIDTPVNPLDKGDL